MLMESSWKDYILPEAGNEDKDSEHFKCQILEARNTLQ